MIRITPVKLHGLLFIFLLSACSQTAQHSMPHTETDALPSTPIQPQSPLSLESPEFWSGIAALDKFHNYRSGIAWRLTPEGIETQDHIIGETVDSNRIEKVWNNYGTLIIQSANKFGVPIELILTTISVESAGDPNAKGGNNYGLMQTTLATAKTSLGNDQLVTADLYNPAIAIEAGTKYLRMQYEGEGWFRESTNFDLPKVVSAYNAGRLNSDPSNPWGMKIYTSNHIDKSIVYFNEALSFLRGQEQIPRMSFAAYFTNQ